MKEEKKGCQLSGFPLLLMTASDARTASRVSSLNPGASQKVCVRAASTSLVAPEKK